MTRILLHIGGEKTGSTYLQHWLHGNARQLLRRHGVLYPTARPLCVRRAHFPLAASLLPPQARDFLPWRQQDSAEPLFAELHRQLRRSGAHTLLLSAEHFASRLDLAAIRRLRHLLDADDVQVLLYARRQDEVALSRFGTDLRNGARNGFQPERIAPQHRAYNPWQVACDWISVFGEANVQVRGYAEAARAGLASDLLQALALPDDGQWTPVQRANPRLHCDEARLLQLLNRHLPTWTEALACGRPDQHRRAMRLRDLVLRHYRARFGETGATLNGLFDHAARAQLLARFADDNARLARRFPAAPAPPPAPCAESPATPGDPGPVCEQTLSDRLAMVLEDAGLRLNGGRITRRWPAAWQRLRAGWQRYAATIRPRHSPDHLGGIAALAASLTSLGQACC